MSMKTIIAIDKMGGVLADENNFIKGQKEKEIIRRKIRTLLIRISEINTVLNDDSIDEIPEYDDWEELKSKRDSVFEEIWKLYSKYNNIEYKEQKPLQDMTAEELAEVLKAVNANRPQQTMNFNAPIGQQIAHVDKIEAHFDKDMGMQISNADEIAHCTKSLNAGGISETTISPRGPRKKFLFIKDGYDTKEDEAVKNHEKERLCGYLSKHCLKSRKLVCTKDDMLNKTITCFLLKWMEMGWTAEEPSGGAVFRFLTDDCGIVSEVQERAYCNRVKEWIKDRNGYDTEVMLNVKDAFK